MEKTRGNIKVKEVILDANVLIDFYNEDPKLIGLVNSHVANILLPKTNLYQVQKLTLPICTNLGLTVFQPSTEVLLQTRAPIPGLSFSDKICFFEAKARNIPFFTYVPNIFASSPGKKIEVNCGLELLATLSKNHHITHSEALKYAQNICSRIPYSTAAKMANLRNRMFC